MSIKSIFTRPRLLLLSTVLPLLLVAYLGSHIRLLSDDYLHLQTGRELDPISNMLHWRETWNGSYSYYFFHGLVGSFAPGITSILPAIIVALWLLGLSWLCYQGLTVLRIKKQRLTLAVALAAAILSATINGLVSPESILWYSASVRYTLPLALITLYLAISLELTKRQVSRRGKALAALAGAVASFGIAGFSELHMALQILLFSAAFFAAFTFLRGRERSVALVMFSSGWCGTVASSLVQITAPGTAIRAAILQEKFAGIAKRDLDYVLRESLSKALEYAVDLDIFTGFILLFAFALFFMLSFWRPCGRPELAGPFQFRQKPLLLGLAVQLLCAPFLWHHVSDDPQLLGRFSYPYASVILLNLIMAAGLLALIGARSYPNGVLQRKGNGLQALLLVSLILILALFAMTKFRNIDWRPATYIVLTTHMILVIAIWQISALLPPLVGRRFAIVALLAYGATVAPCFLFVASSVYTLGLAGLPTRVMTILVHLMSLDGLIWGLFLGYAWQRVNSAGEDARPLTKLARQILLIAILAIIAGITLNFAKLAPDFARYSEAWDRWNRQIIEARDGGQRTVTVSPLAYSIKLYLLRRHGTDELRKAAEYYEVDAIVPADN